MERMAKAMNKGFLPVLRPSNLPHMKVGELERSHIAPEYSPRGKIKYPPLAKETTKKGGSFPWDREQNTEMRNEKEYLYRSRFPKLSP